MAMPLTPVRLALDWTPNTLHAGILVAKSKNFYSARGIALEVISPADDNYAVTPARKVCSGAVDLAVCPSESVLSYQTSRNPVLLQAIFALLDEDASAILCRPDIGIKTAKDLAGRTYGSYNARFEDDIVRAMLQADGSKGDILVDTNPQKLDLFDALKKENIDATWVFLPWEGVQARRSGFHGVELIMDDYKIPYGYSPVIVRNPEPHSLSLDVLRDFIAATREGYRFAVRHRDESVAILKDWCKEEDADFLKESFETVLKYWSPINQWGNMDGERWQTWVQWLEDKKLLEKGVESSALFTNDFISQE